MALAKRDTDAPPTTDTQQSVDILDPSLQDQVDLPPKALKSSTFIRVDGPYALSEPRTGQRFNPGQITEVSEITEWIQCNIDAGVITHLEP
ncbi:hypothetical protein [Methylovulum miyakonense]|uniref:hypothetical protein n=1 Tax=Methylovulum miyakonense TaxID=645578 RepID=UPI00036A5F41|nr:hypothetical protein [Methylovulum miyakonense]